MEGLKLYLRELKHGNKEAWGEIFEITKIPIRRTAYRYLENNSDVDDVVQNTMIVILNRVDRLDDIQEPMP